MSHRFPPHSFLLSTGGDIRSSQQPAACPSNSRENPALGGGWAGGPRAVAAFSLSGLNCTGGGGEGRGGNGTSAASGLALGVIEARSPGGGWGGVGGRLAGLQGLKTQKNSGLCPVSAATTTSYSCVPTGN